MKKLKKLFVALLAAAMLFSLAVPALASVVPLVDPNLCPYCGIGTYSSTSPTIYGTRIEDPVDCVHGHPGEVDGRLKYIYTYTEECTYSFCDCNPYRIKSFERDGGEVCTYTYIGMSLGGEIQ